MSPTPQKRQESLESWFEQFRRGIVGTDHVFEGPFGRKRILYADWTASGRLYEPLERQLLEKFGPLVGNTHSESNVTGGTMTEAYHAAHDIIKRHVNASKTDALLFVGFGMTAAVCKLQRILGLRVPEQILGSIDLPEEDRPVVFVTHMEHHSNQTSWEETIADVIVLSPNEEGLVDVGDLRKKLKTFAKRRFKIGAFTACSNVTGITTPYHALARVMHEHGGICVVDVAASAPYVSIDMHPSDPLERLDGLTFSPHKFLGGPGASGVLIFDSQLYNLKTPDQPGGGTVLWTNPWGGHRYSPDIEVREDGGTPGFLQAVRAALAVRLKEKMDVEKMAVREETLVHRMFEGLRSIDGVHILADNMRQRLPLISFFIDGIHYNFIVRILNDRFGIQVRGGCSCAGTYGHYLLHIDQPSSKVITDLIDHGDLSLRPGWVRASLHPTTTDEEVDQIISAVSDIQKHFPQWKDEYEYSTTTNEFRHKKDTGSYRRTVDEWFG